MAIFKYLTALSSAVTAVATGVIIASLTFVTVSFNDNRSLQDIANQAILNLDNKCSAVLVDDEKNLIATASHCVDAKDEHVPLYLDTYADGERKERKLFFGKVVKYDSIHDVAILQALAVDFPDGTALRIAEEVPGVGDRVYAVGNPLMLPAFVSEGIVTKLWTYPGLLDFVIFSDVKIDHGSSGGALINENNELIGITIAGLGIQSMGFRASEFWTIAANAQHVKKLLQDINEYRL